MARTIYRKGYVDEIIICGTDKQDRQIINNSVGYKFDGNGECYIEMHFYDGLAVATDTSGIVLRYPSLSEIKKGKNRKAEIANYTERDEINQYDVALKYGHLEKYKMVADFDLWVMQGDNSDIDITAIYNDKGKFLFDVLEDDYTQMFCEDIVEGGTLIGNPSEQQISDLKMKYGILWTENIKDDIIKP